MIGKSGIKLGFLLGCLGLASARAERLFPAPVSKITKDTPLFKGPSKDSESLGDAPSGTSILLRGYSPKKTWVLVEDEDGVQAWVPTARVEVPMPDLVDDESGQPILAKDTSAKSDKSEKPDTQPTVPTTVEPGEKLFQPASTVDLSFVARHEFRDFQAVVMLGAQVSLSIYRALQTGADRFSRGELSFGYLRDSHYSINRWLLPIRYSLQNTRLSSNFLMGPDLGFSFGTRRLGSIQKFLGLGYSFGYKFNQFNNIKTRFSYDLGRQSHFAIEGGLQWMFF